MTPIVSYLLFIGDVLYFVSGIMFLYLFIRTLRTVDGIGLTFLKVLTISLSVGSFVVGIIRILSEYGDLDLLIARAMAVTNPILLVGVALYLNYLFHNTDHIIKSLDSKNIKETNKNVKTIKDDIKEIKDTVI
jgi:hypothetical protein